MNVYLEEAGRSHLRKNIKIFEKALSNDESLNLHIIFKRKLGLLELILILRKFKKISSLELIIEPQNISIPIIRFVNSNKKIGIVFIANKELNTNALGRIERCKGIVRIYDNVSQEINVKNQRNLLIARDDIDDIRIADIYNLISRENPLFQCAFSSCLGHTLYVAQNGDVSFCPKYIEESRIGTTNDISNIFENELFYEHLKNTIDHRNKCKNTCEYFDKCKGGCPFEDNCSYFKTIYKSAEEELLSLEENCVDTSKIPLYKELALFNKLCSKIRHK